MAFEIRSRRRVALRATRHYSHCWALTRSTSKTILFSAKGWSSGVEIATSGEGQRGVNPDRGFWGERKIIGSVFLSHKRIFFFFFSYFFSRS